MVSEGVQQGERLVLEGTDRLRDGSEVEVVDPNQAQSPEDAARQPGARQGKRDDSARNDA